MGREHAAQGRHGCQGTEKSLSWPGGGACKRRAHHHLVICHNLRHELPAAPHLLVGVTVAGWGGVLGVVQRVAGWAAATSALWQAVGDMGVDVVGFALPRRRHGRPGPVHQACGQQHQRGSSAPGGEAWHGKGR